MGTPALSFAEYASALEAGLELPAPLIHAVGQSPTPYQVLRDLMPVSELRERGAFFTSAATAGLLWAGAAASLRDGAVVVDPACGAADLLLPAVAHVVEAGLSDVVIRACDVDADFTRVAAARLGTALPPGTGRVEALTRDFLTDDSALSDATHVVLNPPYIPVRVQESWASGQVNAAAYFCIRALKAMPFGSRFLAVLPDVLRSGSRYRSWRAEIDALAALVRLQPLEEFDDQTDVHVFVLEAVRGESIISAAWAPGVGQGATLADVADIRVGPVVPHRDTEVGPLMPYVTARSLTSGERLERRFSGRPEVGPMVLVNRTSRPQSAPRLRARVWDSAESVAVENHLVVVAPKDKRRSTCDQIVRVLEGVQAADFLNERIRLRHVTVSALGEVPWPS